MTGATLRDEVRAVLVERSEDEGWKQVEIARHLGISAKHMSLIWRGVNGMSWEMADAWAAVVGCALVVTLVPRG